jgi:putative heme-binding domain-containing protein
MAALAETDLFARHAAFTALNRIGRAHPTAWPAVVAGLNSTNPRIREATPFVLRDTYSPPLVEALLPMAFDNALAIETRRGALHSLANVHHRPPEWRGEWWAYHPAKAPPPERTLAWAGTPTILASLRRAVADADPDLRLVAVEGLGDARDTNAAPALRARFTEDVDLAVRRAALRALAGLSDRQTAEPLAALLRNGGADPALVTEAIRLAPQFGGAELVEALAARLRAATPDQRLACIEALTRLGGEAAAGALRELFSATSVEERRAAIRAAGQLRDKAAVPPLLQAWQSPGTRTEALAALCRIGDPRALEAFLDGLGSIDPSVREQCRKAMAPLRAQALPIVEARAASLSPTMLAELRRVYADDAEALKKPFLTARAKPSEPGDYERHALAHTGDATNGERVFSNEQGVACIRCHAVAGRGGAVGPDLTLAGAQFSRAQLIESVLYPSRAVREGYQQIIVETKDGEEVNGALKADTSDGLTLVDASGRTNSIPRANIVNRSTSQLSLMPEGLQVGLSLDEFTDLIAYLESRRADGRKAPR